jgi:hypothetical protein
MEKTKWNGREASGWTSRRTRGSGNAGFRQTTHPHGARRAILRRFRGKRYGEPDRFVIGGTPSVFCNFIFCAGLTTLADCGPTAPCLSPQCRREFSETFPFADPEGTQTGAGPIFLSYVPGMFVAPWAGRLSDRWGRRRPLIVAILVTAAGALVTLRRAGAEPNRALPRQIEDIEKPACSDLFDRRGHRRVVIGRDALIGGQHQPLGRRGCRQGGADHEAEIARTVRSRGRRRTMRVGMRKFRLRPASGREPLRRRQRGRRGRPGWGTAGARRFRTDNPL